MFGLNGAILFTTFCLILISVFFARNLWAWIILHFLIRTGEFFIALHMTIVVKPLPNIPKDASFQTEKSGSTALEGTKKAEISKTEDLRDAKLSSSAIEGSLETSEVVVE